MKNKNNHVLDKFVELSGNIEILNVAKYKFYRSLGGSKEEKYASELLDKIGEYKKIPGNIENIIGLDINLLEKQCKQHIKKYSS
jgi:hypothetical protein